MASKETNNSGIDNSTKESLGIMNVCANNLSTSNKNTVDDRGALKKKDRVHFSENVKHDLIA